MAETFERSFEEQLEALAIIDQWQQERNSILENRTINSPANVSKLRDAFQNNRNVKSDVKRSSAFVKKIRAITAEGIQQCVRDTDTLNLTQYISEIVSAILATTYKATELSYVVKLVVSMHQKYEEFSDSLISGLKTILLTVPNEDDAEGAKKKRLNIRFAIELHQQGVLVEDELFCQLMRNLLGKGKMAQMNAAGRPIVDLQGFSMLVKFGAETLFGFLPKQAKDIAIKAEKALEDLPSKLLVSAKVQGILRTLLMETFEHLCADLVKAHKEFRTKESKFEKDKLIHGSITEQKQQEYDQSKRLYERLLSIVTTLSDSTGASVPELKIEKEETENVASGLAVFDGSSIAAAIAEEALLTGGIFGDTETKLFYEELPDLLTLVPLSVFGFTPEQAEAIREEWTKQKQARDEEIQQQPSNDNNNGGSESGNIAADEGMFNAEVGDSTEEVTEDSNESSTTTMNKGNESVDTADASNNASAMANKVDALINVKLQECNTKQKCDEFCVSFCYLNSKSARKKLITALSRLPKFRTDLAPCYARIIASLARLYPEIVEPILSSLRRDFYGNLGTKAAANINNNAAVPRQQTHIDIKIRNVRYQAELVKFRVAPPIVAFRMMKLLMEDLNPQNIEMLVAVMETCGRFLYLFPLTHRMMQENLETMLRLRRAKNLDLHYQTLLESAYFAVRPPERIHQSNKKELSLVQKYARYLIVERLSKDNLPVEDVIKHLRRLPWFPSSTSPAALPATDDNLPTAVAEDENIAYHVIKASLKVARTKYVSIPLVADCLSGLAQYHTNVIVALMDRILEEIQRSLESPYKREIQRIMGLTRLVGELYNFTAIPSAMIFELLYHVLRFGHEVTVSDSSFTASANNINNYDKGVNNQTKKIYDPRIFYEADTPTDPFRAQIICELLNTTGMYFVRGAAKEKLDRFLAYFQRYLFTKKMIPMHVEFTILDCFDTLDNLAKDAAVEVLKKANKAALKEKERSNKKKFGSSKKLANVVEDMDLAYTVTNYQFSRYDTFENAHLAVEKYEGKETVDASANNNAEGIKNEAGNKNVNTSTENKDIAITTNNRQEGVKNQDIDSDDQDSGDEGSDDEDEEDVEGSDSDDHEDEDEDEDEQSSSSDDEDEEDEDDEEDEEDEDDSSSDDDEDEDHANDDGSLSEEEATRVLQKMRIAEEDDEFDRIFKSAMQESRASVVTKSINVDKMTIPAILPKPKNVYQEDEEEDNGRNNAIPKVPLKLLSRDNKGRVETRQLLVPRDHTMVQQMMKSEEAARLQRERIMERTLLLSSAMNNSSNAGGGAMNDSMDTSASQDYYMNDYNAGRYFGQREVYHENTAGSSSNKNANANSELNNNRVNRSKMGYRSYEDSKRAATTLDLDGFLAETNAAEIRKISSRKNP